MIIKSGTSGMFFRQNHYEIFRYFQVTAILIGELGRFAKCRHFFFFFFWLKAAFSQVAIL